MSLCPVRRYIGRYPYSDWFPCARLDSTLGDTHSRADVPVRSKTVQWELPIPGLTSLCSARHYIGSLSLLGMPPLCKAGQCMGWWSSWVEGIWDFTGRDTSADRQQFLCKLDVCPTQSMSYGVVQDRHHLRIHCCDSNLVRCGRHRLRCNLKVFMFHFYKKDFDNCCNIPWMYFENHAYNNPYYQPLNNVQYRSRKWFI